MCIYFDAEFFLSYHVLPLFILKKIMLFILVVVCNVLDCFYIVQRYELAVFCFFFLFYFKSGMDINENVANAIYHSM